MVRKNTIARDPIGSTRNSITRRDRRSLRRRILEEVDHGLKMNTEKIVGEWEMQSVYVTCSDWFRVSIPEYNPKLSDATPTTRVAYVKFMARTLRKEQTADDAEMQVVSEKKSILRSTSKTALVSCQHCQ